MYTGSNSDDASLLDAFKRYDDNGDGDGEISFDEFVALVEDLGDDLSDAEQRLLSPRPIAMTMVASTSKSSRLGGTTPEATRRTVDRLGRHRAPLK